SPRRWRLSSRGDRSQESGVRRALTPAPSPPYHGAPRQAVSPRPCARERRGESTADTSRQAEGGRRGSRGPDAFPQNPTPKTQYPRIHPTPTPSVFGQGGPQLSLRIAALIVGE